MTPLRLTEVCRLCGEAGFATRLEGEDRIVRSVNTLEEAGDGELSFLSNPKYASAARQTRASAVVAKEGVELPPGTAVIRCRDPYGAITVAIVALHGHRRHPKWGMHSDASIDASAKIGSDANIASRVAISAGVDIGANCTIYPGCYLAEGVRLGDDCTLFPNVVIYDRCELGHRVTVHAGSVIGEDGLGYAPRGDKWVKIPQAGRTVIGDDVEIGANCTIDRATIGQTEIGSGTKFGNVVVIGHGTKIGPDCLFVGLVGVAGSVTVGRHVTLAGQVGVAGHLAIGDGVTVGAQSGIAGDVEPNSTVFGSPAIPIETARRSMYVVQKLPDWVRRIKDLEREVQELKEMVNANGPLTR
jgi:UDP-3-O-[3-hydroxymyristoyl] glucosamine N-acyltransferase